MAINPLIALSTQAPDITPGVNMLLEGIRRGPALEERKTNIAENRLKRQEAFDKGQINRINSVGLLGEEILPDLQAGNLDAVEIRLKNRLSDLRSINHPNTEDTEAALQMLRTNPQGLMKRAQNAITLRNRLNLQTSDNSLTSSQKDFKQFQNLQKTDPKAAEVFGRQAGFLSKEGQELSSHLQKRLSEASDEAVSSSSASRNYLNLAQDLERLSPVGGAPAKFSEFMKNVTGTEDAVSLTRQEYRKIRNSEAVANLPPGVASDKDVELALSAFPDDTSNPQFVASFLRGLSKLAKFRADYNEFKAQYISDKGTERGFLDAWKKRAKELEPPKSTQSASNIQNMSDEDLLSF